MCVKIKINLLVHDKVRRSINKLCSDYGEINPRSGSGDPLSAHTH